MSEALVINGNAFSMNPPIVNPNIKRKKKKVMAEIKGKLEQAKLNLIYTELDELTIPYDKDCKTVKELTGKLKRQLPELDFNKYKTIAKKVEKSLDGMVGSLEKGSTTAFTKLMTSDLAKTIGKTLGISLAGRAALILAPTIGTKALVGLGLGAYSLYRVIKNRKDVIRANEENELNNILKDLEITKDGDKYVDTRFSESIQNDIKEYLANVDVTYEDTGYRSLREAIYALPSDKKRSLCELLNNKMGKGIEIDERIKKARKKLNVVAATSANIGVGAGLGVQVANTINSIDPALGAGVLNGTVLGAWIEAQTHSGWYTALTGGLGLIGTEVIAHIPYIGGIAQKFFAAENLAACCAIGATGGLVVSGALTAVSIVKNIRGHIENNKEIQKFIALDSAKYQEEDKKEMAIISKKLSEPANNIETVVIDIVLGYLKDEGIELGGTPKSINELNGLVNKLQGKDKKKAKDIVVRITDEINNDPSFVGQLKKAGQISIGLFTAGLAVMSVYDILKGGTFLPELSTKLFPNNNIHTPVPVPDPIDKPLDVNNSSDAHIYNHNKSTYDEFNTDAYQIENDGDAAIEWGAEFAQDNDGVAGITGGAKVVDYGLTLNAWDKILRLFGIEPAHEMVPNVPMIADRLRDLSPHQLYNFYRTFSTIPDDGSEVYKAVQHVLLSNNFLEKATEYVNGFARTQQMHDIINDLVVKVSTGAIPLAVALETLGLIEKGKTSDKYAIQDEEVQTMNM